METIKEKTLIIDENFEGMNFLMLKYLKWMMVLLTGGTKIKDGYYPCQMKK